MANAVNKQFVVSNKLNQSSDANTKQKISLLGGMYNKEEIQAFSDGLITGNEDGYRTACEDLRRHLATLSNNNPEMTIREALKTIIFAK